MRERGTQYWDGAVSSCVAIKLRTWNEHGCVQTRSQSTQSILFLFFFIMLKLSLRRGLFKISGLWSLWVSAFDKTRGKAVTLGFPPWESVRDGERSDVLLTWQARFISALLILRERGLWGNNCLSHSVYRVMTWPDSTTSGTTRKHFSQDLRNAQTWLVRRLK